MGDVGRIFQTSRSLPEKPLPGPVRRRPSGTRNNPEQNKRPASAQTNGRARLMYDTAVGFLSLEMRWVGLCHLLLGPAPIFKL